MMNKPILWMTIAALATSFALPCADAQAQRRRRRAPVEEPAPEPEPPPPTEEEIRARQHFESGRSYFEASRYADAAREFSESYELSGRGELLVNLASAHERDLDHTAAIAVLERLRDQHPGVMEADEIARRIEYLQRAAEAQAAAEAAARAAAAAPPPPPPEDPTLSILGWSLVGAGAGALVAGGVMAGLTYDSMQQFDGSTRVVDQLRLRDQVREQALIADILFGAGGALAVGGVIVLVLDALDEGAESEPTAATARLLPYVGPSGAGLGVVGRF